MRVVIVVEGGFVNYVLADAPSVDVEVIDLDDAVQDERDHQDAEERLETLQRAGMWRAYKR